MKKLLCLLFAAFLLCVSASDKPVPVDQNGKSAIWVGKMTLDIVKNK